MKESYALRIRQGRSAEAASAARGRDIRGEPEWLRWVREHLASAVLPMAVASLAVVLRPELVGLSMGGVR